MRFPKRCVFALKHTSITSFFTVVLMKNYWRSKWCLSDFISSKTNKPNYSQNSLQKLLQQYDVWLQKIVLYSTVRSSANSNYVASESLLTANLKLSDGCCCCCFQMLRRVWYQVQVSRCRIPDALFMERLVWHHPTNQHQHRVIEHCFQLLRSYLLCRSLLHSLPYWASKLKSIHSVAKLLIDAIKFFAFLKKK